jgi:hypothetical protein
MAFMCRPGSSGPEDDKLDKVDGAGASSARMHATWKTARVSLLAMFVQSRGLLNVKESSLELEGYKLTT